jgi:20S proteasome subunit alpha 2
MICENIGLVYSGMGPDARLLLLKARKLAQVYRCNLGENPPVAMLVRDLANVFQEYTQSGGVRPFGVSFLVAGVDEYQGASLYQVDPSGTYWAWKAAAIGKNFVNAKSFLEKRYSDELDLEDAIHTAIQTLRQVFEGQLTPNNIQIGIADATSGMFHLLTPTEVEEHLTYAQ